MSIIVYIIDILMILQEKRKGDYYEAVNINYSNFNFYDAFEWM